MNAYEKFDNYLFATGSSSGHVTGEFSSRTPACRRATTRRSGREYWDGERVALADALQRGELDAEGLAAWSGKISRAIEEIADADDEQGVITRRGEFVEVIDLRPMSYHDGDVTAYQIAVILCG